jgi:hypothetical protein
MLEQLNPPMLAEHVGSAFDVVDGPARAFSLALTRVVEHSKTERAEAVSLFFHGPPDRYLPQGMRRLEHGQPGTLEIFLVPVAREQDGFQYEAVFNNLV